MSKPVLVYKNMSGKIVVECRHELMRNNNAYVTLASGSPYSPDFTFIRRICIARYFAAAYGTLKWNAYIDDSIRPEEITEDIYNTIFMMNKKRK